jgi:hypothetical protein
VINTIAYFPRTSLTKVFFIALNKGEREKEERGIEKGWERG